MTRAVEGWLTAPLALFVRDAGVRCALVLEPSGRVLAAHGFTRSVDVMSASRLPRHPCDSKDLGRLVQDHPNGALHYAARRAQLFSLRCRDGRALIVLASSTTSLARCRARLFWRLRRVGSHSDGNERDTGATTRAGLRERPQSQSGRAVRSRLTSRSCQSSTTQRARSSARSSMLDQGGPARRRTCSTSTIACRVTDEARWYRWRPKPNARCSSTSAHRVRHHF